MEPETETELLSRARAIAGHTVSEVARSLGVGPRAPGHKGYVGSLVERAIGLCAHGPGPDAPKLGVELKTTPIDPKGVPRESTFVCMVPRDGLDRAWSESAPRRKLGRVLFVPVESDGEPEARRIGTAFFWSPDEAQEASLANDWAELAGLLRVHGHEHVSARHGVVMQVRPKAASAASRWRATGEDDTPVLALPRAFYLRRSFVSAILSRSGLARP